jgi:hypothetical protein
MVEWVNLRKRALDMCKSKKNGKTWICSVQRWRPHIHYYRHGLRHYYRHGLTCRQ